MKLIPIILLLTSCTVSQVHHKENLKNSIKNMETMMKWLEEDVKRGLIPETTARNYYYILELSKQGIIKKVK